MPAMSTVPTVALDSLTGWPPLADTAGDSEPKIIVQKYENTKNMSIYQNIYYKQNIVEFLILEYTQIFFVIFHLYNKY